jgi:hypothetical protein
VTSFFKGIIEGYQENHLIGLCKGQTSDDEARIAEKKHLRAKVTAVPRHI